MTYHTQVLTAKSPLPLCMYALSHPAKRNPVLAKVVPNRLENAVDLLLPNSIEAVLDKAASKTSSELQPNGKMMHACCFPCHLTCQQQTSKSRVWEVNACYCTCFTKFRQHQACDQQTSLGSFEVDSATLTDFGQHQAQHQMGKINLDQHLYCRVGTKSMWHQQNSGTVTCCAMPDAILLLCLLLLPT